MTPITTVRGPYVKFKNMQIEIIINNNNLKTWYRNIPASVHFNYCVSSSVRPICFPQITSDTAC